MFIARYKKWLLGGAIAIASLIPFGSSSARGAESASRVPVKTLAYRGDADQPPTHEVRWGRGYYRGPYGAYYGGPRGYYGGPRYYSGYRGYGYGGRYYAPYDGFYGRGYYGPGYYGPGPGYYGRGYYGGGVRVGGLGIFWR